MHIVSFHTRDSLPIEEGSILKYIASEYDKNTMDYGHVMQVIGDPPEGDNADITHYTFATTNEAYKTHIKVV